MKSREIRASTIVKALGRKLVVARVALFWERLWPALWPATGVCGLFIALSLLDTWTVLSGWIHVTGLLILVAAFGVALWHGLSKLLPPDQEDARRRLERHSGLLHRPLTTLNDSLATAGTDEGTRELWRLHRRRALASIRRLRIGLPSPGLARFDTRAIRAAVGLLLFIGFSVAGGESWDRIVSGVAPSFAGARVTPPIVEAWIAPPAYTQLPPILLKQRETLIPSEADSDETMQISQIIETIQVPAGSELLAKVNGGKGLPTVHLDRRSIPFALVDGDVFELRTNIETARRLVIQQMDEPLGVWKLDIVPDRPPTIAFNEIPVETQRSALRIDYSAGDDYGLADVHLEIRLSETDELYEIEMILAGPNVKSANDTAFQDLTPHAWAGLPARARLRAEDQINQRGFSEEFEITLPQRDFRQPVARAIIEQRKRLAVEPEAREDIARAIRAIAALPEEYYDDYTSFLTMNSAGRRLERSGEDAVMDDARQVLWDTALRIEDGALSIAEREVRMLEQALLEALARNAPPHEIERLMNELQEALDRFLQALAEQALQTAEDTAGLQAIENDILALSRDDLQRLLDRARELSRMGSKDAARELLSQLRSILENLLVGVMSSQQREAQRRGQRNLRDLGELMMRQQQLLDRSFRRAQQGQQGRQGQRGQQGQQPPDATADAGMQEALRRMLGEIMRRLGENSGDIPEALGEGELSMRAAREALSRNRNDQAIGPQTNALEQLRAGAGAIMQQMLSDIGMEEGPGTGDDDVDPLGRPMQGAGIDIGDDVKVPDKASLQKAKEILDELHRRASQRTRPQPELEYIDRLLRRF